MEIKIITHVRIRIGSFFNNIYLFKRFNELNLSLWDCNTDSILRSNKFPGSEKLS